MHAEPDCVGEKPFISVAFQDALNLANDARGVLLKTDRAAYFTRFYDMLFQDKGGKKFRPSTSEIAGESYTTNYFVGLMAKRKGRLTGVGK